MRTKAAVSIVFLLVAFRGMTFAQDPRPDDEIVRAVDNEERLAALRRDVPALERLWSDQFTVNAPNNKVVIGKRAVMDEFVVTGVIHFTTFDRRVEFIRVDGDYAFVMGAETVQPAAGPSAGQIVRRRFTNIWRKEAGHWRLFARHANVIPKS